MLLGKWILDDYVWRCDNNIRLVYITLILSADETGHTKHTVSTLADAAKLPLNTVVTALRFLAENNKSDNTIFAGKRVYVKDGTIAVYIPDTQKSEQVNEVGMAQASPAPTNPISYENVKSTGLLAGLTEDEVDAFYHHFNAQGWVRANGQPITNIASAINAWKIRNRNTPAAPKEYPQQPQKRKMPLLTIVGKNCSTRGCGMPAVYKSSGEYPTYYCRQHIPPKIKEKLREEYEVD